MQERQRAITTQTTPSSRQLLLGVVDGIDKLLDHGDVLEPQPVRDGLGVGAETEEGRKDLFLLERERRVERKVLRGGIAASSVNRSEARGRTRNNAR